MVQDGTLRHLAAVEQRRVPRPFEVLLESIGDAVYGLDRYGRCTFISTAAAQILGYTSDELLGQNIHERIHHSHPAGSRYPLHACALCRVLHTGHEDCATDAVVWRRDGTELHADYVARPLLEGGVPIGALVTLTTEGKGAEEALRRSEQRFRFLLLRAYQLLEQRAAERTGALAALYDVTAVASASRDLATILDHALDRIVAVLESEAATIHLVEGTPAVLRLAAARGLRAAVLAQEDPVLRAPQLGRALLRRRHPLVIADLAADRRTARASDVYPSRTYAGVPIRAKGQVLGVLSVLRDRGRPFSADEASLLAATGEQLGVAVAHARLVAEVQNKAALEERQRLAHDLHDSVTQSLYSLTLLAEAARRVVGTDQRHQVAEYVTRLGEAAQQALKEMRLLLYELRPLALQREGLVGAVQQRLDAVEKRAGVETHLLVEGTLDLPALAEVELYHIIQEALNNAMKHAAARSVTVRIRAEGARVDVTVTDDGRGFDPHGVGDAGGLGLPSMRARVERLGGALTIRSQPGAGTTVAVRVDSREASHASA
jgi:PAS domain S-box-containing protein